MNLQYLGLIRTESPETGRKIVVAAVTAGVMQGAIVGVVNAAAKKSAEGKLDYRLLALIVLLTIGYIFTKRYSLRQAARLVQRMVAALRTRIASRIRHCSLGKFDHTGRELIFTALSREAQTISETTPFLINAAASLIMLVCTATYIAFLSRTALTIVLAVMACGAGYYFATQTSLFAVLQRAMNVENGFFGALNHLLDGFKEVKMNARRGNDLLDNRLRQSAEETADIKTELDYEFTNIIVFGQVFFYTLLTAMIFILPIFDAEGSKVVVPLTAAALFLIGPLGEVVGVIPYWSKANVAVDNLKRLETLLEPDDLSDDKQPERSGLKAVLDSGTLREICCEEAVFSHLDRNNQRVFTIGPLKLCLKAGEVVFVVGGNGSGKSTFLKLLAGLYQPQLGRLVVNGDIPVDAYNSAQYREFFSAIFSEFHLFDRLYGLPEPDSAKLLGLLQKMQLQDKTDLRQGQFTNLDLSTGQRKRMALLVALLEDRPVFLFDEVAADQDPEFRRYFYETILSELKARGKTVVVVTHDDRYFSYGDRVLKMEFGRFVETP